MDSLNIFKAFQLYYSDSKSIENFTQLLKLVDFYSESQKELKIKFQSYLDDKTITLKAVATDINSIMNRSAKHLQLYRQNYPENFESNAWHNLLNDLIKVYYENLPPNEESDLDLINNNVLGPFLTHANEVRLSIGFEYGIEEIFISVSNIRKQLYSLRMDSNNFANHLEQMHAKFYRPESEYFEKMSKLKESLKINTCA